MKDSIYEFVHVSLTVGRISTNTLHCENRLSCSILTHLPTHRHTVVMSCSHMYSYDDWTYLKHNYHMNTPQRVYIQTCYLSSLWLFWYKTKASHYSFGKLSHKYPWIHHIDFTLSTKAFTCLVCVFLLV